MKSEIDWEGLSFVKNRKEYLSKKEKTFLTEDEIKKINIAIQNMLRASTVINNQYENARYRFLLCNQKYEP